MPRPEIVLFDIGNVLIEWQPERFYDRLQPPVDWRRMFAEVDLHAINDQIDRGAGFRETIYTAAAQNPEFETLIHLWHDRWIDIASPAISASASLNMALRKKGIATGLLSNIGAETFARARAEYPFLDDFAPKFLSGEIGHIKPEPEIYAHVEQSLDVPPNAILFADDRLDNIKAAQDRGWLGHQFTSAERWADCLMGHGLLDQKDVSAALCGKTDFTS